MNNHLPGNYGKQKPEAPMRESPSTARLSPRAHPPYKPNTKNQLKMPPFFTLQQTNQTKKKKKQTRRQIASKNGYRRSRKTITSCRSRRHRGRRGWRGCRGRGAWEGRGRAWGALRGRGWTTTPARRRGGGSGAEPPAWPSRPPAKLVGSPKPGKKTVSDAGEIGGLYVMEVSWNDENGLGWFSLFWN